MDNGRPEPCRIWELIPVKVDSFNSRPSSSKSRMDSSSAVPPYEEHAASGEHSCTCSHAATEPSDDGYGTTVIEITTVTTRKKYRVEDERGVLKPDLKIRFL
jgi:hypothetical protein